MAIESVVSNVVERILLDRLSEYLDTMGNQLGFKPKLGTDMCIYSLKEIIGSYSQLNGCVFSCFLDAPKAFDRVKHSMLIVKTRRKFAHVLVCASDNMCSMGRFSFI